MIHLGFEVGTGRAVEIPLRHTAVFGQTQESGKTTTLEGLINRSKLRGLAFVTKRGESSFHVKKSIPPYFRERTDWKFVAAILEATLSEKLKFQRSWIMKLCRAGHGKSGKTEYSWPVPKTLADVQSNVEIALKSARGISESVYFELAEYLKDIIPEIDRLPYTTTLELAPGVNVMDLAAYEFPLQALVVRSAMEWIRKREHGAVCVVPESHKFAPKQRGSPVKLEAEDFIRESAALRNFLWIDCQDVAGVADVLLRQIGVWIFGVQRAKHEIERTLDAIPEGLLARRPGAGDVATLGKGQFFACWGREMWKVYVQPAWMKAAHAEAIARGEEPVESAREVLKDYEEEHPDADRTGEKDAGGGAQGETVHLLQLQSEPETANGRRGAGPSDRGALRGVHSAGSEFDRHTAHIEKNFSQPDGHGFDGYEEAEEAMKSATHEIDVLCGRCREHLASLPPAVRQDFAQLIGVAKSVLPSPSAKAEEAETGAEHQSGPAPGLSPEMLLTHVSPRVMDGIYAYVKERAKNERDPVILHLLSTQPELRVKVTRQIIEADGGTLQGAVALLISKKFFDSPQNGNTTFNELKRQGRSVAKPNVYRVLDKLAELGFVTKEATGYQAVPGMRVFIEEEKAVAAR